MLRQNGLRVQESDRRGQRCYNIERTESTEASCSVKRRSNDGSRVDGIIRGDYCVATGAAANSL